MAETRELSTSMVRAANCSSSTKIHLTPWDSRLLAVDPIQKGLLYCKSENQENTHKFLDHLKISLSRTLDFFPPLAGRLATIKHEDNNTRSFYIDCNNQGAQFIHAVASGITVNDILNAKYVPKIVRSFFSCNGVNKLEETWRPLLTVQVTELEDGCFIGCTLNHGVVDGTSFWHFFNSWAEISRGFQSPSKHPILERWFPEDVDIPIQIPFSDEKLLEEFIPPQTEERFFRFSREKVTELKERANSDHSCNNISSFQAVLAHLWQSITRCRNDDRRNIRLIIPVGRRRRLSPPLPEGYFGNAVKAVSITTAAPQLLSCGLGWAASQINEALASQTDEETRNWYRYWVNSPTILTKGAILSDCLIVSSSPRFNVYGNDFGWGKPAAVRTGSGNKTDGKITFFPGPEPGSMDVEICLLEETLNVMDEDVEFMKYVSP
ncbi:hypothetical protein F511_08205 [Dorcoceras hygrometricum]|uniref:HXXXD-type acyl-transferase family protein n=1 Tax=Dorcoceras hygrometricum TaxID=472368 RepID=A0A2Z7BYM5_9LAMI|nr:hypothetical protein F511_08205 [Dorcoceras hygrometricum]